MINYFTDIFKLYSNNIAYKINDKYITYSELLNKSIYYSELLKKEGSSPVLIYGHKDINMIVSIFSCIFANRPYVVIDKSIPVTRIQSIINITKSSLMLLNESVNIESSIEKIKLEDLIKYKNKNTQIFENDIVYIVFTSGSTGIPKGVPISKENLFNFINWINNLYPLSSYKSINVLNQVNFNFDVSVADIFYSLTNGHTLIGFDRETKESYLDIFNIILKNNIDVIVSTPTFMKMIILNKDFNHINYPNLKCVYLCGEVLDKITVNKLLNAFPSLNIINAYGPSEATSAVSSSLITKEMLNEDSLPIGEINKAAVDICIEDEEIVLKGKSVFNGYLGDKIGGYYKENNINCYRTGDLGYIDNNQLYYIGRKDNQIKYKGYRIELEEIEKSIKGIEHILDCAVIAKRYDNNTVKLIIAYVVLESSYDEEYVKQKLKKILPDYMIPKIIKKIDNLPVNPNGKVDRKALKEL